MDYKLLFQKYYSKLRKEGIIKSAPIALIVGFSLSVIVAVITLIAKIDGLWLCIGIAFGVAVAVTPLIYLIKFRPTTKTVAERIDRLGLQERLITMMEFEKDESFIAMRQREDAKSRLKGFKSEHLRINVFSLPVVIVLAVVFVLAAASATISKLYAEDLIGPGQSDPVYVTVEYEVSDDGGGKGSIHGEVKQTVLFEGDAATVVAVADDGFIFDQWSDGLRSAERTDTNVKENLAFTARFLKLTEEDAPQDADEISEDEENEDGIPQESPPGGTDPGGGEGSRHEESNQIIDGKEYYRDHYQDYYDMAMQIIASGGDIPDYIRSIVETYFEIIV